jgi:hypothetical protein
LPKEFIAMSLKNDLAPMLSAAIIEDWLDAADKRECDGIY